MSVINNHAGGALTAGQAMMTVKCLDELFAGTLTTAQNYRLMLMNLSLGALTITAIFNYWSQLSDAEVPTGGNYTKGAGITLSGDTILSPSTYVRGLDFDVPTLANQTYDTNAWALCRWVTNTTDSPILALGLWAGGMKSPAAGDLTLTIDSPIRFTAIEAA